MYQANHEGASERRRLTQAEEEQLVELYATAISDTTRADVEYVLVALPLKLAALDPSDQPPAAMVARVNLLRHVLSEVHTGVRAMTWEETQVIAAALFYFVMPFDLIPDCVPQEGFLDDAFILGLCMEQMRSVLDPIIQERGETPGDYGLDSSQQD